jgi:hypothetical protein
MRFAQKSLSLSIVIAILFAILFAIVPSNVQAHAHTNISPTWETIVRRADPHVHVVNNIASIDSQITTVLTTDQLEQVKKAVDTYNKLPLKTRQHPHVAGTYIVKSNSITPAYAYQWTYDVYWWGVRIWLNSPAAQNFNYAMTILGAGIGAAVGGIIGTVPGAVIGAIIGAIAGSVAAWVDNECGNRGIFIDINWILQVSINPVC